MNVTLLGSFSANGSCQLPIPYEWLTLSSLSSSYTEVNVLSNNSDTSVLYLYHFYLNANAESEQMSRMPDCSVEDTVD